MPMNTGNLAKAMLQSINKLEADDIIFMFNPKDLSFSTSVKTADNAGARSEKTGRPKVSFSDIPPKTIEIKDIWFDTYETGEDVKKQYLQKFISAVTFSTNKERPPLYRFVWKEVYFESCFIEQLNYRLTKFLPDGTPVRAVIETLGLKETEDPAKDAAKQKKSQPDAKNDNKKTRTQKRPQPDATKDNRRTRG